MINISTPTRNIVRTLSVCATLPVVLYTIYYVLKDVITILLKYGWGSRPFIYIRGEYVFTYAVFVFSLILVTFWISDKWSDSIIRKCFWVNGVMLFVYWLCFLLSAIGFTVVQ